MLCIGCGTELSVPRNRRALDPTRGDRDVQVVSSLWLERVGSLFIAEPGLAQLGIDPQKILSGSDPARPSKMCKKCFTAYSTCSKYLEGIEVNLKKALTSLQSLEAVENPAKRPRLSNEGNESQPSTSGVSPGVRVSF